VRDVAEIDEAALDREIDALVRVEPPPGFAARVHRAIESDIARPRWHTFVMLASGTMAASTVVWLLAISQAAVPMPRAIPLQAAIHMDPSLSLPTRRDAGRLLAEMETRPAVAKAPADRSARAIVPRDEVRALQRLLIDAGRGEIRIALRMARTDGGSAPSPIEIPPIAIEPLFESSSRGVSP
jgi:hypothetical protein